MNPRQDAGSSSRRIQPSPDSNRSTPSSRWVDRGRSDSGNEGARNRADDSRRNSGIELDRRVAESRASRERRDDSLKRYAERRDDAGRGRVEARSPENSGRDSGSSNSGNSRDNSSGGSRSIGSSRIGSGAIPGSGFGSRDRSSDRRDSSSGIETDTSRSGDRVRARNRTVFPDESSGNKGPESVGSSTRGREAFGRGGLTTVEPTRRPNRGALRGRVARETVSSDAPNLWQSRGKVAEGRRLEPITPREKAEGRVEKAANSGSGRNHLDSGYFRGSNFWGLDHGDRHHHNRDHSSFSISFGFGGGRDYCNSYLYGASYSSYWDYWRFGVYSPYHLGYASPAHVSFGYQTSFRSHARYHFGYSSYLPCSRRTPYPFYRTSYWQPWYVDHWSGWCPSYRSYYLIYEDSYRYQPDYYVETSDPYVDEEVVILTSDIDVLDYNPESVAALEPALDGGVPVAFQRTFSDDVPADLDFDQLLAFGEEALYGSDYLVAAEAFRRASRLRWEDDYPKFQLSLALFGAERFDLAYLALELGLDQNPAWLYRRFDLRDAFESQKEFEARLSALERYLIRNDRNDEARFLLGYLYYFSDNLFGARSVVRILGDSSSSRFPHLDILAREAEKRIVRDRR